MTGTFTPTRSGDSQSNHLAHLAALRQSHTYREIHAQPAVWRAWAMQLAPQVLALQSWLQAANHERIWLCGAGSSAFIGESLVGHLNGLEASTRFCAVASTDIVSQPRHALQHAGALLLVSFGRSGSSSESIATLDALDAIAPHVDRLHISCNSHGVLAQRAAPGPGALHKIVLPPATHDAGFAMTSSFSTMLLTALALFDKSVPLAAEKFLPQLADSAHALLQILPDWLGRQACTCPERVVFLGSGPLLAAARESALKVLELTAGAVPTLWDSPLGFRHGPKAFVNAQTRVFIFVSPDPFTQNYDLDLAQELRAQWGPDTVVCIGPEVGHCDVTLAVVRNAAWSGVIYVVFAQYLAMYWSQMLQLPVDQPFTSGHLNRVVSGVKLYPPHTA